MHVILDILIPRFITEEVAIVYGVDGKVNVLCCVQDLNDYDIYDAIATSKCFNFFGFGLAASISNFRDV